MLWFPFVGASPGPSVSRYLCGASHSGPQFWDSLLGHLFAFAILRWRRRSLPDLQLVCVQWQPLGCRLPTISTWDVGGSQLHDRAARTLALFCVMTILHPTVLGELVLRTFDSYSYLSDVAAVPPLHRLETARLRRRSTRHAFLRSMAGPSSTIFALLSTGPHSILVPPGRQSGLCAMTTRLVVDYPPSFSWTWADSSSPIELR